MYTSSETQGQIVGTRESLNGWKNVARRKEKNGEKSPWGQCLTRPVPDGRRRSGFWLVPENLCTLYTLHKVLYNALFNAKSVNSRIHHLKEIKTLTLHFALLESTQAEVVYLPSRQPLQVCHCSWPVCQEPGQLFVEWQVQHQEEEVSTEPWHLKTGKCTNG